MYLTKAAARPLKLGVGAGGILLVAFVFLSGLFRTTHVVSSTTPVFGTSGGAGGATTTTTTAEDVFALCESHGFHPFFSHSATASPDDPAAGRKVYDLFLISSELDWLEIRLHELAPHVDYFVIVEAATTFTGLAKPLYLREAWGNFSAFHAQMIHRVVADPGAAIGLRSWDHEDFLRNALVDVVFPSLADTPQAPRDGDVLVVSDVDEIPKPATLQTLRHCAFPRRLTLRSHFYYYSFQWRHRGRQWQHPQATTWRGVEGTLAPQDLRSGRGGGASWFFLANWYARWRESADLWNAAWHCSSCFATLGQMQEKMAAFSHTKWNTAENRDPATIIDRVRHGWDLFGRRGEEYDRVEHNLDVPRWILEQSGRFGYMLDRDGEDAGFSDVGEMAATG